MDSHLGILDFKFPPVGCVNEIIVFLWPRWKAFISYKAGARDNFEEFRESLYLQLRLTDNLNFMGAFQYKVTRVLKKITILLSHFGYSTAPREPYFFGRMKYIFE